MGMIPMEYPTFHLYFLGSPEGSCVHWENASDLWDIPSYNPSNSSVCWHAIDINASCDQN